MELIKLIIEAAAAFAKLLADAFKRDDDAEVRRLADVLGEPLKSQLVKEHGEEKLRREYRETIGGE